MIVDDKCNLIKDSLKIDYSCSSNINYLYNDDFKNGTYIICNPGIYVICDNIEFEPNKFNNCKPTPDQRESGVYSHNDFTFGFFACIHIKCSHVKLDLNGHTISMSRFFRICQRFASIVSIGMHPFLSGQGPGKVFMDKVDFIREVCIMGHSDMKTIGCIDNSVHQCIRANKCKGISLCNLHLSNFEVAGIHLAGCSEIFIDTVKIYKSSNDVISIGRYSQLQFITEILINLSLKYSDDFEFETHLGKYKLSSIIKENKEYLDEVMDSVKLNKEYNGIFKKELTVPEGIMYGCIITSPGVAIGPLKTNTPTEYISQNIFINDLEIFDMESLPETICAFETKCDMKEITKIKSLSGCPCSSLSNINSEWMKLNDGSGGIMQPIHCCDEFGQWKHDALSTSQFMCGYLTQLDESNREFTRNTVSSCILQEEWVKNGGILNDIILKHSDVLRYSTANIDLMAHIIKKDVGLIIQQSRNILIHNCKINGIKNLQEFGGCSGLCISGCETIFLDHDFSKKINEISSSFNNDYELINNKDMNTVNYFNNCIEHVEQKNLEDVKETKFKVPEIIHKKKNKPILPKRKLNGKKIQDAVNKLEETSE